MSLSLLTVKVNQAAARLCGYNVEGLMKELSELQQSLAGQAPGSRPPIESWHPQREIEMDIRIDRQGVWYYQKRPIQRPQLVQLFASILRREGSDYYLVTPSEKARIEVEADPIVIVDLAFDLEADELSFISRQGHEYLLGQEAEFLPLPNEASGEEGLRLKLDRGLTARLDRPVWYRLADQLELEATGKVGLRVGNRLWMLP